MPDPQAVETYERSRLHWAETGRPPHSDLLDWYRALIDLRRRTPALRDGNAALCDVTCHDEAQWMLVRRRDIAIACNLAPEARTIVTSGALTVLLASEPDITVADGIGLPPDSVAIVAVG